MNLGEMRALIQARLVRDDADAALVDGFLAEGIRRIEREVRAPIMEASFPVDTSAGGVETFTQPTGYLETIDLLHEGLPLTRKPHAELLRYTPSNPPAVYSRFGQTFYVRGTVPQNTSLVLLHYARFPPLVVDADTNRLLDEESDLALYAALIAAGAHFQHEKSGEWQALYVASRDGVNAAAMDEAIRGGVMAVQPAYAYPDD